MIFARALSVTLCLFTFLGVLPISPVSAADEQVILHLKWMHGFQFAGYYAAQTQGFFADEGLSVVIKEPTADDMALEGVLSGESHFGVWGAEILNQRLAGKPVVVLGVIFQHSPYGAVSLKESNINVPGDLLGKKVAFANEMGISQLQAMLLKEGLPLGQVIIVPFDWGGTEMIAGNIDVEFTYFTDTPHQLKLKGYQSSVIKPVHYGVDYYGDCLFTSEKMVHEYPELVERFRRACFRGWDYASHHTDELIDHILTLPGVRDRGLTREHLQFEMEKTLPLLQSDLVAVGHSNPDRWHHMAELQVELGMVTPGYSLDGFIYEPVPPIGGKWLWPLLLILGVVTLLVLGLIGFSLQLRRAVARGTADLRQNENQLRNLFENAPVGLWLEDFSRIKSRFQEIRAMGVTDFHSYLEENPAELELLAKLITVVDVNLEAVRLHNADIKENLLESIDSTFNEKTLQTFREEMITLFEGKTEFEADTQIVALDGKKVDILMRLVLGGDDDDWSKTYLAMVDISERVESEKARLGLERQVQHTQKLESLGILAGGIAHDFNNLLQVITGNADMALEQTELSGDSQKHLLEIRGAGNRAADLCHQMLAYSGKGQFRVESFDLNELTREISGLLKSIVSKKIELELDLAAQELTILADVAQVQQVVLNLITNAAEAIGSETGKVSLSTSVMECDSSALNSFRLGETANPGKYVLLKVTDTGQGISDEAMEKLFDPFFSTKFSGRGLGLSAVLGIVQGHHGAIKVESGLGRGSIFTVLFPLADKEPSPIKTSTGDTDTDQRWQGEGLVLVAEDEAEVMEITTRMLKKLGFETLEAIDGVEAVEQFQKRGSEIKFILLDLTMPRMGGEEAFRRIRDISQDVPVLFTSGFCEDEFDTKQTWAGITDFIKKPYEMKVFRSVIKDFYQEFSN